MSDVRVLHIITRLILGGAQENTLLSVEGLDGLPEYDVVLATGLDHGREGELISRARTTSRLVIVPELGRSINPLNDVKALWRLYRVIREGGYHIVHTHSSKAGVLGRLAAKLAGTPVVVHTLHSMVFHDYQPRVINRALWAIKKLMAPLTDHYISVADAISEIAIREGIAPRERFTTIYSGMELDWYLEAQHDGPRVRAELGIPSDALVVGKIARLFPLKGHEQLFDAAAEIVRRNPRVHFLLIGDGILREELVERAEREGIRDHFTFAGLIPRERIPEMIAAMDVLVHTSLREGLARALPQALAMGVPCVSVDLDGAPEVVVDGETGYLVPPGDASVLAERLTAILSDAELRARMGEAGRRRVDPAFRAETMVREIAEVYAAQLARRAERVRRFEGRRGAVRIPSAAAQTPVDPVGAARSS